MKMNSLFNKWAWLMFAAVFSFMGLRFLRFKFSTENLLYLSFLFFILGSLIGVLFQKTKFGKKRYILLGIVSGFILGFLGARFAPTGSPLSTISNIIIIPVFLLSQLFLGLLLFLGVDESTVWTPLLVAPGQTSLSVAPFFYMTLIPMIIYLMINRKK